MPWERNADGYRTLKHDWYRGELPEGITEKQVVAIEQAMDLFFEKHPQEEQTLPLGISLKRHGGSVLRDMRVIGFSETVEVDISVDIYGNIMQEFWGHAGGFDFIHGDIEDERDEECFEDE